jgi:lipopolysaccharide/colanic/teichoic acid biosynthesis glycosyltransferase
MSAHVSILRHVRLALHDLTPRARRAFDVVIAGSALLLLAIPLALVALAIRLESRGPVLFSQMRGGLHGRAFRMWKLRSMVVDAEEVRRRMLRAGVGASGARFKLKRDPRITRIGRVIRKLSIDELPQLWNVLRGDMTLVGPRPAPVSECDLYDPRALRRMEVKPGLTCLWQVRGRSDLDFEQQVALDLEYVDRATAWDDVRILLATVPAVLTGRGAY